MESQLNRKVLYLILISLAFSVALIFVGLSVNFNHEYSVSEFHFFNYVLVIGGLFFSLTTLISIAIRTIRFSINNNIVTFSWLFLLKKRQVEISDINEIRQLNSSDWTFQSPRYRLYFKNNAHIDLVPNLYNNFNEMISLLKN